MSDERSLLIGHTGFVGSTLARQRAFTTAVSSATIDSVRGQSFDLVVCAGVRAEKWKANADPVGDRAMIAGLTDVLATISAHRFVLISTVDVFPVPVGVDERSAAGTAGTQPYGENRLALETLVRAQFNATVVRLPGLYGQGLKKNIIYDLLHDNRVANIDPRGVFQFYGLHRLWNDVAIALEKQISLIHLPTQPVAVSDVARVAFGRVLAAPSGAPPARYDVRTVHGQLFDGAVPAPSGGYYLEPRDTVLEGIRAFVESARR